MAEKASYKELEQKIRDLEKKAVEHNRSIKERKQTEEAFRESEARYRGIFENTRNGVAVYEAVNDGEDFIFVDFNTSAEKSENIKRDELIGKSILEMFPGVKEFGLFDVFKRVWATGKAEHHPVSIYSDERLTGWRENFVYKIPSGEIVAVYSDETERKQAEDRQRFLSTVVEQAGDSIVCTDNELRITYINDAAKKLYGWSLDELRGKTPDIFNIEPTAAEIQAEVYNIISSGKTYFGEALNRRKDRSKFYCQFKVSPLFAADGKINGYMGSQRDVTDRKQSEESLRESEEKYRRLFENERDALMIFDAETGLFEDANRSTLDLYGYTKTEFLKLTAEDISAEPEKTRMAVREVRDETGSERIPLRYQKKKDGTTIPVEIASGAFTIKGRKKIIGAVRDISERIRAAEEKKELEARIHEAQKLEAVGTLAGGVAHDFNNLLATIQGNASLMLYDIGSTHPHHELLQEIIQQVRSGAGLTSQLLGYARKGKYQVTPFNLNQLLEDTSHTFGRVRKKITIHRELAEDLLGIKADRSQIEQVLLNLFINASGAMPGGGKLILKTMNVTHKDMKDRLYEPSPGSYVLLTVTDTGTGMDKETQERIFEPFFTTKEMGRGTGLGLASVYGIIKGHGGYIHVDSEKGRGTTFSIYLPASDKKVEAVVKTADQFAKGSGTILLVDDEARVLNMSIKMLKKLGYTVLGAKSGKEAIEIYEANKDKIDLVVLDMIMPDIGGGEVYDRMKEINPNVKAILASGYSIEGEATAILERGCDAFIQKPFEMGELSEKAKELIGKS